MRISELLISIASWLESPDNEAILLAEYNDQCLTKVTHACVKAADIIKQAANEVDLIEPEESVITPESIEKLADIATAFDKSNDSQLIDIASVIDEMIVKVSDKEELKEKKKEEGKKDIEKSKVIKDYKILEQPMSSRHCPDHPGVGVYRVEEGVYQCKLDHKIYDYTQGFTKEDGSKVPGYSISGQTNIEDNTRISIFDTRESRIFQ